MLRRFCSFHDFSKCAFTSSNRQFIKQVRKANVSCGIIVATDSNRKGASNIALARTGRAENNNVSLIRYVFAGGEL